MFKKLTSSVSTVFHQQKRFNSIHSEFSPTALLTFTFLKIEKGTANEIFAYVSKEYPGRFRSKTYLKEVLHHMKIQKITFIV
eukprot:gene2291-2464_t